MDETQIDTILGDDIVFRGRIHFKKNFKVNGRLSGRIQSSGHLIVGPAATVQADIEAGRVTIEGNVTGNILAAEQIDVHKSAKVHGDIRTPALRMEPGSKFSGSCIMD
jgi:cytoskeletal protein CcmA (bactofilin family)